MIKDIPELKVEDVALAIVKEENEYSETIWNSYLINLKKRALDAVLVTSTGYGILNEEKVNTSTLRHFLDTVQPNTFVKIEPIIEDVFGLNNEYWVSFYLDKKLYDKKFIFLPETILEENLINIPVINKKGVMIK
ncbi:MAG: hypothetical protein IPP56_04775 [Bacteroidetes bacterium]|jgi:hypothetical protein|nr:hypothetical protein [Bacteroidota bacterium]MBK9673649.1 hypothetical protein [Bacteroidota bacterium]MBK9799058.1 hypothetical protein [Bacteroidota bacterium]